jgi:hypothetical protein
MSSYPKWMQPRWTLNRDADGNIVSVVDETGAVRKAVPARFCNCEATAWGHLCAAARLAFEPALQLVRRACRRPASRCHPAAPGSRDPIRVLRLDQQTSSPAAPSFEVLSQPPSTSENSSVSESNQGNKGAFRMNHFSPHSEGARDLRLVLLWTAALLLAGSAANLIAMVLA